MSDTPESKMVRARDVVPYAWAVWCSVEGSEPFANEICGVRWSEDGQSLWFMLESHNFLKADPDEMLDLVPYRSKWRTDEMVARDVAKHARILANPPHLAACVACRQALPSEGEP